MKNKLNIIACAVALAWLGGVAAAETLFERYIPVAQVYSAQVSPYAVSAGKNCNFQWGTRFVDENYNIPELAKFIKRNQYPNCFVKVTYLGVFGNMKPESVKKMMNFYTNSDAYKIAMGTQKAGGNFQKTIDKNSIIIKIDLHDAQKKFVRNISPACAIIAVEPNGEFLTYSCGGGKNCSLFFSMQNDLCKITDDKSSSVFIHFTPTHAWLADKSVAEGLLGSGGNSSPIKSDYKFVQHPPLNQENPQYMTNNILSGTEFIDPFGTYYKVGEGTGLDPVVKVKIENVVDYSEYGRVLSPEESERSILTKDGTLYGVNSRSGEKRILAKGVKQAGKAHYMTADGTVKEIVTGKAIAKDCQAFAEHRFAEIIGVLKKDGTLGLGYTYICQTKGNYEKGLQKMNGKFKGVVAGGAVTEDNRFFRWKENVINGEADKDALSRGLLTYKTDYSLSLEQVGEKAVRVFPYEYFTEEDSTSFEAVTGFVVEEDGYVWAFGLHRQFVLSNNKRIFKMGLVKHIFPIYFTRGKFSDNGNFVAFLCENDPNVKALVANHCTQNKPMAGDLSIPYLSDVPEGFKATNGNTYSFDNESTKLFATMPTAFHYLNDKREVYHAMSTHDNSIDNMDLLPNVARSSYRMDGRNSTVVLLERTDGSMWMTRIFSKVSAADKVALLGGWENTNAIQVTPPTTKISGRCDYVDLLGGSASTVVNLGPVDATKVARPKRVTAFLEDANLVSISGEQAQKMYERGEQFVLLMCNSGCGWCEQLKMGLSATLRSENFAIYSVLDDSVGFPWKFVAGNTVGTPCAAIVGGKSDVEVVSAIHSQAEMKSVLQKAKKKGIPSAKTSGSSSKSDNSAKTNQAQKSGDSYFVELSAAQAEQKYNNGEKFVALVTSSTCGWCRQVKTWLPSKLASVGYAIYEVNNDGDTLRFPWRFVKADKYGNKSLGTPYAVIVGGKGDVEVVSAVRSEDAVMGVIQKAKKKGIPEANSASSATSSKTNQSANASQSQIDYSQLEKEVVAEMNLVRKNPAEYAQKYIEPRLKYFSGNSYKEPGKITLMTNEGAAAVSECVAELKKAKAVGELKYEAGIAKAAKEHANDQAKNGGIGHTGSDGRSPFDRMSRYGAFRTAGENVAYATSTARDIVIQLLIDDGVADRGHRKNIMHAAFNSAGVGFAKGHPQFNYVCVIDYAGGWKDK